MIKIELTKKEVWILKKLIIFGERETLRIKDIHTISKKEVEDIEEKLTLTQSELSLILDNFGGTVFTKNK